MRSRLCLGDALEPADGLDRDAGEDLHEGVVREHGDRRLRVAHPLGAVHSTKTKMQSGGWTERCDGKSGVCRMRTRERRSSGEAYRHRRWSGADDGGDAGRCRARGSGAETKRSSWWAVGRGGSLVRT